MDMTIKLCVWISIAVTLKGATGWPYCSLCNVFQVKTQSTSELPPDSLDMEYPYIDELASNVCGVRPPVKSSECCIQPLLFPEKNFLDCGIWTQDVPESNVSVEIDTSVNCTQKNCILHKHNLVNNNDTLNVSAFIEYLDEWVLEHPAFKVALEMIKELCGEPDLRPEDVCLHERLIICFSSVIYSECPVWRKTESCAKLKEYKKACPTFQQKKYIDYLAN